MVQHDLYMDLRGCLQIYTTELSYTLCGSVWLYIQTFCTAFAAPIGLLPVVLPCPTLHLHPTLKLELGLKGNCHENRTI